MFDTFRTNMGSWWSYIWPSKEEIERKVKEKEKEKELERKEKEKRETQISTALLMYATERETELSKNSKDIQAAENFLQSCPFQYFKEQWMVRKMSFNINNAKAVVTTLIDEYKFVDAFSRNLLKSIQNMEQDERKYSTCDVRNIKSVFYISFVIMFKTGMNFATPCKTCIFMQGSNSCWLRQIQGVTYSNPTIFIWQSSCSK